MGMETIVLPFPAAGENSRAGYENQPQLTCSASLNVRLNSTKGGRDRGGVRPGLIEPLGTSPGSGMVTMANPVRFFEDEQNKSRMVYAAGGNIYMETDSGTHGGTSASGISPYNQVISVPAFGKMYIINTGRTGAGDWPSKANEAYNPSSGGFIAPSGSANVAARTAFDGPPLVFSPIPKTIAPLAVSYYDPGPNTRPKGAVPTGCTMGCLYRGRLGVAGPPSNPEAWFFSRIGDPTDWDYAAPEVDAYDEAKAVSHANNTSGAIAQPMTAMVPHDDQCIVMATRTELWIMNGDPASGVLKNMSRNIGIIDKMAWCHTPDGWLVFLSANGVYGIPNQCAENIPKELSRPVIPEELINIDPTLYATSLTYDVRDECVHVFVSPYFSDVYDSHHWCIHWPSKSFFRYEPADSSMDPIVATSRTDRADANSLVVMGDRQGRLLGFSRAATDDLGTNFDSSVIYPPIALPGTSEILVRWLVAKIAEDSGQFQWKMRLGSSTREATQAAVFSSGRLGQAGMGLTTPRIPINGRGTSVQVEIHGIPGNTWAMEQLTLGYEQIVCAGGCK